MNVTGPQPLLPAALILHGLGLSVVPTKYGQKVPAVKWRTFQKERADEATLRRWFGDADNCHLGLGIVLGGVSGGMLVRDFDRQDAYSTWRDEHPELGRSLPTVETRRGCHVYCRASDYLPIGATTLCRKGIDGELRADGHIVVVPPSIHCASGLPYRWLIEPTATIPLINLHDSGLVPATAKETQENISCVPCAYLAGSLAEALPEIIRATLPRGPGERHRMVFEFARYLRGFPEVTDKNPAELEPYIRQWHSLAKSVIRTKDFETTFADFEDGWTRVRFPAGMGTLTEAVQRALTAAPPRIAEQFPSPQLRLLVTLCRELQRQAGERPFFLTCRHAANAIGLGEHAYKRAWQWLRMLCDPAIEILKLVSSGTFEGRRANEYLYLPPID